MIHEYVYATAPIDFWEGAMYASNRERELVLRQMPEEPRDGEVYKLYLFIPGECELTPVLLCKADNNGTVYVFSERELPYEPSLSWSIIRNRCEDCYDCAIEEKDRKCVREREGRL